MSSEPVVFRSKYEPIPTVDTSVFTYLFRDSDVYPPERLAFIDAVTGDGITRGQLKTLALSLSHGLRRTPVVPSQDGKQLLRRGDVVMFLSPNSLSWPIALFGAVAAGLRLSLASSSLTAREISWQWRDSRPQLIFVSRSHVETAIQMFALIDIPRDEAMTRIWVMDDLWRAKATDPPLNVNWLGNLLGDQKIREETFNGRDADETLYICYSSGTTGRPKGVESSHRGAGSILSMAWTLFQSVKSRHDVALAILPFYRIFGLIGHLHHSFYIGATTVIMTQGYDPTAFCQAVEKYQVTMVMVVPPMLLSLTHHPGVERFDLRSLTAMISGGAPMSPALVKAFSERFARQGSKPVVIQGYGATETTLTVMVVPPENWVTKFGSVGILAPNLEVRIIKDVSPSGAVVEAGEGEPGELWIRGPTVMKGYLHNPTATEESFHEGWYKTGDILRRDRDGHFFVIDRKKEMIKYKGLQVAPAELEAILLENPDVQDVGVIGILDSYSGNELPRAYVVPSDKSVLESREATSAFEQQVQRWIIGRVARHKELRGGVVVVAMIPKSPTGKILRRELRDFANASKNLTAYIPTSKL